MKDVRFLRELIHYGGENTANYFGTLRNVFRQFGFISGLKNHQLVNAHFTGDLFLSEPHHPQ